MSRLNILLLGDSLTQRSFGLETCGWGAAINEWYVRSGNVTNNGFSGYNSRWIRAMLPQLFPLPLCTRYDLATILLGANDAASSGSTQHVPLPEYKENLVFIVNYLKTNINPDVVIILITPPPNNQDKIDPAWDLRKDVNQYKTVVQELAAELDISLLDLWDGPFAVSPRTDLLDDGLHFDVAANRKVADGVKSIVATEHPSLLPERWYCFPDMVSLIGQDSAVVAQLVASWTPSQRS